MARAFPICLDSLSKVTRREARVLAAGGRMARALGAHARSIEAVVERYAGARARLKFIVPRSLSDMRPGPGSGGFDGVVARVRCIDPPAGLLVMAPASLCTTLACAILGTDTPPAFTDPSLYEAVLGHLLCDVIRCLPAGVPPLRLDALAAVQGQEVLEDGGGSAVVFVRVRMGDLTDIVTVVLDGEDVMALGDASGWAGPPVWPPAVRELRYEAAIVVAGGSVSVAELARLEPGDVVLADRMAAGIGPDGPGRTFACDLAACAPSRITFVARAEVSADGLAIRRGGPLIMEGDMDRDDGNTEIDPSPGVARPADDREDSRVKDLPASMVVEAGRVVMSVGELLALAPGSVIPLERPVSAEVTLTVGGRPLAHGVLVDVEGEIGVQVLKVIG